MAKTTRARSTDDHDVEQSPISAREAVELGPEYFTEIAGRQPTRTTSVVPTDDSGWFVEVEVVEERRIPSSADILALYELELDADGELLAVERTRRYGRGERLLLTGDADQAVNGDANGAGPQ